MLITLYAAAAFAATNSEIPFYTDKQTQIKVSKTNPEFVLKLQSNPTTGYSWFIKSYDKSLITPVNNVYQKPQTRLVGAGGYELWKFKVNDKAENLPQHTSITMTYKRPWEKNGDHSDLVFEIDVE